MQVTEDQKAVLVRVEAVRSMHLPIFKVIATPAVAVYLATFSFPVEAQNVVLLTKDGQELINADGIATEVSGMVPLVVVADAITKIPVADKVVVSVVSITSLPLSIMIFMEPVWNDKVPGIYDDISPTTVLVIKEVVLNPVYVAVRVKRKGFLRGEVPNISPQAHKDQGLENFVRTVVETPDFQAVERIVDSLTGINLVVSLIVIVIDPEVYRETSEITKVGFSVEILSPITIQKATKVVKQVPTKGFMPGAQAIATHGLALDKGFLVPGSVAKKQKSSKPEGNTGKIVSSFSDIRKSNIVFFSLKQNRRDNPSNDR